LVAVIDLILGHELVGANSTLNRRVTGRRGPCMELTLHIRAYC
jgi:hypothetical protein